MKALVTGGAGFVGSHLTDALLARGDRVRVLDNLWRGRLDHLTKQDALTIQIDDVRDYAAVLTAMDGVDVVYHLAAQSNVMGAVSDLDYSFTTNVVGTFNVLKAASDARVGRVVFASSREVYGEPGRVPVHEAAPLRAKNPYGASKIAAEAYCRVWERTAGVPCVILRFVNLYGPRDRDRVIPTWLQRARDGEDLPLYGGDQVLDFLWVGYAVAALLHAADVPGGRPINVGSGRGVRIIDLAQRILSMTRGGSSLRCAPARDIEVVRFIADVRRMRRLLAIDPPRDPLDRLRNMTIDGCDSSQSALTPSMRE